ncbi:glycosyltransferase [Oscillochloris trichoides DG-6]|uniref:Glycosyltransferase n=1 Tax=Oscillochloris trichoides DG-6 TaxID=765420 RepID=E1ICI1_9CHLR|nr:glycosyltransferase [Oscillochloris trichoides]EFO81109.1 glycosyltransferase [Oscillochloris trichoides DG-6]
MQTLSIFLPVRNQATTLATMVAECMAVASQHCTDYEIILVDDGSDDGTSQQADHLAFSYDPVMVLHMPEPRGYAAALRAAWAVARGEYLFASNPYGPVAINELPHLLMQHDAHAVVLGYRAQRSTSPLSLFYTILVRLLLGVALTDPSLRYALFRRDMAELLPAHVPDGLAHGEIYARAYRAGMAVTQVEVNSQRGQEALDSAALFELIRYYQQGGVQQRIKLGFLLILAAIFLWLARRRS